MADFRTVQKFSEGTDAVSEATEARISWQAEFMFSETEAKATS